MDKPIVMNYGMDENGRYSWHMLKRLLEFNVMSVNFTKTDGSARNMICTLNPLYIDGSVKPDRNAINKNPTDSIRVWDIEKHSWRSFRLDRITSTAIYPTK